ncbi:MAG: CPBP family intramembrane metalloprotease, partial [Clostridia bacterium]|nr:CPBP family intramembrane metalloprotease [Clostridia bacterium]
IVWGLWHLPVDFFYYSPDAGLVAAVSQQITCITLGIFFAYAYMKTNNIWVPVILHFLNNNLIPVLSGNNSADVLKNQQMAWSDLPLALLLNGIVFGLFILSKEFSEKKILNESHDELPDQAETP